VRSIRGKTINDLARRVLHGDARLRLLWPPFFPEVVYDSTGVFDGCSVGGQQCPVRIIDLVISIGDDEEVTRHGEPIIAD
jgi:hypothetical protein